ncbi:MAG TPA: amidohydrolase family protein, partial [Flavisolibacter sp.]
MKRLFSALLLVLLYQPLLAQVQADLLIKNGRILDGSGNSWYWGDVAVKAGKIFKMGKLQGITATKTIDAKGMYVTPGFIDVHGHIESGILATPTANNYIHDGVTTVVTGNCG